MGYNKLLLKGLFKMYKNLELKNFKNKIINLCDKIADSLDILEFGSKSSDTKILVRRIELLEKQILNLLIEFENFIILLIENENFECIQKEIMNIKALLSILRCCLSSSEKNFEHMGITLVCDLIFDKCKFINKKKKKI